MSAVFTHDEQDAHDSTLRDEPLVREIAGIYVASTTLDPATAEIVADDAAMDKIRRRRRRGMDNAVFAEDLPVDEIEWANDGE